MIEKLPDINSITGGNDSLMFKKACESLWDKTSELIDKVNALEKAVKQIDRPVELE